MAGISQALFGSGRWRWMRALAPMFLLLVCLGARAADPRIAEPSAGLAFSPDEVNRSRAGEKSRFMQRAATAGLLGCALHCAAVARVWAALQPVLQRQQGAASQPLSLVLVRMGDIEALSFPDGTLVVSEALITRMGLEDAQIAFVLAHEASHVLMQHERQTLTSMLALMPSRVKRTPRDLYVELEYRYFSMNDAFTVMFHQIEFEADEIGLQLASLAGFRPDEQMVFMEKLAAVDAGRSMFATHPVAQRRLVHLREMLPLARRLFRVAGQ